MSEHRVWLLLAWVSDGIGIGLAFGLGFGIRSLSPNDLMPIDVYLSLAAVCVISFWGILAGVGGYRKSVRLSPFDELVVMSVALLGSFGLVLAGAFFLRSISLSRLVLVYAAGLAFVSLTLTRTVIRLGLGWLRAQGYGIQQVLWVGADPLLPDVLDRLRRSPQLGFELVGYVGRDPSEHLPTVTDPDHLISYLQAHPPITELWFAEPQSATSELLLSLQYLGRTDLQIRLLPDILGFLTVKLSLQLLDGIPLLTVNPPPLRYWQNRAYKRLLDIFGSGLGLLLLSPLMLVIGIGIRLSSPGSVLYRQERISLDGQTFSIYKFRSMKTNAEVSNQPGWTRPEDPRRTWLGGLLRRYNLDELPQLWNVFKGEMSLVGPRPERPFYVAQFSQEIPKYLDRHLVKTGLTGWAQIHGLRGDTSIVQRTQYDLYYVQNWSLLLDLRILCQTLWQALTGRIRGY